MMLVRHDRRRRCRATEKGHSRTRARKVCRTPVTLPITLTRPARRKAAPSRPRRRPDAQPPIGDRHAAADEHDQRSDPDEPHERVEIEPHGIAAVGLLITEHDVGDRRAASSGCRASVVGCGGAS